MTYILFFFSFFCFPLLQDLSNTFKLRRIALGYSQQELSKCINKHRTFVSKVENNQKKLTLEEYVLYCKALKIDPSKHL